MISYLNQKFENSECFIFEKMQYFPEEVINIIYSYTCAEIVVNKDHITEYIPFTGSNKLGVLHIKQTTTIVGGEKSQYVAVLGTVRHIMGTYISIKEIDIILDEYTELEELAICRHVQSLEFGRDVIAKCSNYNLKKLYLNISDFGYRPERRDKILIDIIYAADKQDDPLIEHVKNINHLSLEMSGTEYTGQMIALSRQLCERTGTRIDLIYEGVIHATSIMESGKVYTRINRIIIRDLKKDLCPLMGLSSYVEFKEYVFIDKRVFYKEDIKIIQEIYEEPPKFEVRELNVYGPEEIMRKDIFSSFSYLFPSIESIRFYCSQRESYISDSIEILEKLPYLNSIICSPFKNDFITELLFSSDILCSKIKTFVARTITRGNSMLFLKLLTNVEMIKINSITMTIVDNKDYYRKYIRELRIILNELKNLRVIDIYLTPYYPMYGPPFGRKVDKYIDLSYIKNGTEIIIHGEEKTANNIINDLTTS